METFLKNLRKNKVTLDIKTNNFQEKYVYDETPDKFKKIEDISMLYKQCLNNGPRRAPEAKRPHKVDEQAISDPFLYGILFYQDETISLLNTAHKNVKIDRYLSTLKKEMEMHIRAFGFTRRRLTEDMIWTQKPLFYEYMSKLANISLIVDNNIYEVDNVADCLVFDSSYDIIDKSTLKAYKLKLYKEKALAYTKENLIEKTVSELKKIADDIGFETSKIVDHKKKPLLKKELQEGIKDKIAIILSPIRENGN